MDSASCRTMATEFETKEMVPIRKFVPLLISAAAPKVRSSTGTSPKVSEVRISTVTTTIPTTAMMVFISSAMASACTSPSSEETWRS